MVAGFADATGAFLPLIATLNAARILTATEAILGVGHDEFARLALAAAPGAGGVALVPYFEGERTPNLPDASASLSGLTLASTTRENLARAAIEWMLCGLADGLDAIVRHGLEPRRLLLVGGAARSAAVPAIASEVLGLPVVVLGSLVSSATSGLDDALPVLLAVNAALLLVPAGVASALSARLAYPAPRPGDSAFVQPQAPGASGAGSQALAFGLGLLLSSPAVVLAVQTLFFEGDRDQAILAGLGSAVGVFALGVLLGGFLFDRRAAELVSFTSRY